MSSKAFLNIFFSFQCPKIDSKRCKTVLNHILIPLKALNAIHSKSFYVDQKADLKSYSNDIKA